MNPADGWMNRENKKNSCQPAGRPHKRGIPSSSVKEEFLFFTVSIFLPPEF